MANFEINDFSISRNRITFGDDLNVKFAILNTLGSGKTIKEVTVRLYAKAAGSDRYDLAVAQFAYNMPISITNNKSKAFDFTAKVPAAEDLPALWAAVSADTSIRALEIALHVGVDYIQSGTSYGASVDYELSHLIKNPVFFLRSRCTPTITEFWLQRAISGVASDEGENLVSTVKLDMADTAEASNMALTLLYEQGASVNQASARMDLTAHIPDLLAGVTDSETLIESLFTNSSDWDFKLVFGDAYEETVAYASIARAFANVHMSGKSTGGVCLGGFSSSEEGDPKFESYYKAHMYGGIHGVTDYAETEQQTYGTWIDGRSIYRKTEIIDVTSAGSTATGMMIHGYLQSVVDLKGTFYRTGNDRWYPISFDYNDSSYVDAWVANYAVNVRAAWAGVAYVTVFYTKSTDTPGTVPALIDSTGSTLADSDGSTLAAAAAADVYYLSHTGAQVDAAVTQANELYGKYTAGELGGGTVDTKAILQAVYPVGSLYMSANATDPAVLFDFGTWERVKDTFLLAAGDSYAAGSTGGEATHKLTVEELPAHSHAASMTEAGDHTHTIGTDTDATYSSSGKCCSVHKAETGAQQFNGRTSTNGAHTHGITVSDTGGNAAHNNMPPYLAVYVFKRTA
jgi:hypothetical protein